MDISASQTQPSDTIPQAHECLTEGLPSPTPPSETGPFPLTNYIHPVHTRDLLKSDFYP